MPDVIGQPYTAAASSLTRAGLLVAPAIIQAPAAPAQPGANPAPPAQPGANPAGTLPPVSGTVIAQNPPAGYPVDPTMSIQLTVAQ
jgi:beta-lactam-binding protein with PASTA domain